MNDFEIPRDKAKPRMHSLDRCEKCGAQYAYLTSAKGPELACSACHHPAPASHPDVMKLERELAERRDREMKEELRRAEQHAQAPQDLAPAAQVNPLDALATLLGAARRELMELRKEVVSLRAEVDQLKAAYDDRPAGKRRS